ncbi:DUF302 domain-containing protein [Sulfurovum mangrovi]|uniref:DUF302 domain-containing protein n=1 Tax=Sulfurovum mangrovi TaxID=2893889 RepID=UPI001E38BEA2|nr:DUF302 domain-containing protein [Sulfurovum mangrovi]UFH59277.1 DUF302 domain-containing protein [Sulfurovum mangrovi]
MKKRTLLIGMILGLVVSIFVTGSAFKTAAPTMFFNEVNVPYSFDKTVQMLQDRINKQEGWHVTGVIDQQKEILEHGGEDVGKVKIINFCNGKLSGEMLSRDKSKFMAVNMPLGIAVYEKSDGRVTIGLTNGYFMARLFSGRDEAVIMEQVIQDMEEILSFIHFRYTLF